MEKYVVGARNNKKDNYTIVCKTRFYILAFFMRFLTEPFVNEIEIVKESNVVIKKRFFNDNEYYYVED